MPTGHLTPDGMQDNMFSVFSMPNVQTQGALATYIAARHAMGSPVDVVAMTLERLEFLMHVSRLHR
jgi:hypothetical protein